MKRGLSLAGVILCLAASAWADNIRGAAPGVLQRQTEDALERYQLEKRLKEQKQAPDEKTIKDETAPPSAPEQKGDGQKIFVKKIVTDRSGILTEEEIKGVTAVYEGRAVSINDLFTVVNEINKLYASKKYAIARAILPPQKVDDGIVTIRLIEGRIGDVLVENNKHTRSRFVTDRVSLKQNDLIRLDTLERDILYFNITTDVQMRAELKAGREFGTTDLILKVQEPPQYQVTLFADNAGHDTTGLYRAGTIMTISSLFGMRDALSAGGIWSEGTLEGWASYSIPINRYGTRLGAYYDYNKMEVIEGRFASLNIHGSSFHFMANLQHPVVVSESTKVNAYLSMHYKGTRQYFDDFLLPRTHVASMEAGLDYLSYDAHGLWYLKGAVTNGGHFMGGDKSFIRYNQSIMRQQVLGKDVVLVLKGSGQLSNASLLPPSEQFQVGGMSTVRGYSEGLLIGDHGYAVSAELAFPLFLPEDEILGFSPKKALQGFLFVDHGGAFPYKGNDQSIDNDDFLTSVGAGLNLNISKYLSGKFSFALPLQNREKDHSTIRVHFYVQSVIF